MSHTATLLLLIALTGCGSPDEAASEPTVAAEPEPQSESESEPEPEGPDRDSQVEDLEAELRWHLEGRDLLLYIVGIEAGGGDRVRVLTQLDEEQSEEAEAICNVTTVAAYGLDHVTVSGVDVAAAGGRNIAACVPKV